MVKIAAMGDNVVDCYVARGEMFPGGNCLNVAVNVARFGGESAYVGAIGRDAAGELIRTALSAEKVNIARLRHLDGATAYCLIGSREGDRIFLDFDLGVSMFTPDEADLEFLAGFQAVHIGQSSGLDAWIASAGHKTLISYDFSTRRDAKHRRDIGRHCYLASISGEDLDPDELNDVMRELLESGATWVLATRGRAGALLRNSSTSYSTPARIIQPVDTLGAGDAFISRVLYGLLGDETPEHALGQAAEAAATTCRHFGAIGHGAAIDILRTDREVREWADVQMRG